MVMSLRIGIRSFLIKRDSFESKKGPARKEKNIKNKNDNNQNCFPRVLCDHACFDFVNIVTSLGHPQPCQQDYFYNNNMDPNPN